MAHRVDIKETGEQFWVEPQESILQAAQRQGVRIHSDCEFGGCGTCRIQVTRGQVSYEDDCLPMSISDQEHEQGHAAACQARLQADIEISLANHIDVLPDTQQVTARVHSVARACQGIWHLVLQLPDEAVVPFRPGQYLNILFDDGRARSFSMANADARSGRIELYVREVEGGRFTQACLPGLKAGDALQVQLPLGVFYWRERDWRPMVMVATGTGIAPIRAILESLLDNADCPPVSLYWGMNRPEDLYLAQEFASWADRLCEFQFVPVLSHADQDWSGARGYVQQQVCRDIPDLSEHAVYLCGSPVMIEQAQALFAEHGADARFMYADAFNFQTDACKAETSAA
ncbi:2Fe-2S iron-sulfur cluster-binding protein [Alcaligenes sp. SDU_A2]|uniref:2Fe-2S iron-sulfur cluster-binding protein n=1 Tax=Alcaligenes sp. SDU_A2 TaxID=3136634 RepID=UPI002C64544D|nr:2Fe-2S iron-sulfur cluster-binding protein [Alcaligenes sp.]